VGDWKVAGAEAADVKADGTEGAAGDDREGGLGRGVSVEGVGGGAGVGWGYSLTRK
jgi:hypothetical protein